MIISDLHIHTVHSDGNQTIEDIIYKLDENLRYIAITDHNTIDLVPYKEISNVGIIQGIEISCYHEKKHYDLLCYSLNPKLSQSLEKLLMDINNSKKIWLSMVLENINSNVFFNKISNGVFLIPTDVRDSTLRGFTYKRQILESISTKFNQQIDAVTEHLSNVFPKEYEFYYPDYKDAISILVESEYTLSLAHPYRYMNSNNIEKVISNFKDFGLACIEFYHPSQNDKMQILINDLAKKYELLITGGSDFHNDRYGGKIGSHGLDKTETDFFLNRLYK